MPPCNRRTGQTEALLQAYIRHNKGRERRATLRRRAVARVRRGSQQERSGGIDLAALLSDSSLSSTSSDSDSTTDDSESSSSDSWSDILGPDWRFLGDTTIQGLSLDIDTDATSESETSSEEMPELRSIGRGSDSDSESEDEWVWLAGGGLSDVDMSGMDGDDEESLSDRDMGAGPHPPLLRRWIQEEIDSMHSSRYREPRNTLPRGPSYLHHVLLKLKAGRPDHFRQNLRISPATFDKLVKELKHDPVFFNHWQKRKSRADF
ncbi:hypothetical protein B0H16DRAFT_1749151 [Mycena metata]|uniref:Uncharacterized protein n=1 Tax=Mycena metata TaxID=1033252 RepID=A0AAD7DXF5_9AGAR|nr:hypothetical protein B0H16DRAFT_1749151 [Mycena metata]